MVGTIYYSRVPGEGETCLGVGLVTGGFRDFGVCQSNEAVPPGGAQSPPGVEAAGLGSGTFSSPVILTGLDFSDRTSEPSQEVRACVGSIPPGSSAEWRSKDPLRLTQPIKEIAVNLTKTYSRSGTLSIRINGTYVFNGSVGTGTQTVLSVAKDVSTIAKNGDIPIVATFAADSPEPPGNVSVESVDTANGNGFDVLLTRKLVQTRSYTFLSVPLDTEQRVTKLTSFTATSAPGVSWAALDENESVSLQNGEFVFQTRGKRIQFKATFSQRSDAKPGNAIQGYSAQTVLAPLPSDSLVTEHSYSYDLKGNRSLYDSSGLTYYPGTDRLKQTPTATYAYDDNGNLVEKTTNDGTKLTYIYDARNLLIEVKKTLSGGSPVTIARYLYDSEGNRIQSDYPVDGSSVLYQFDLSGQLTENPIMEERPGSTWNFVYLNRQLLARVDGTVGTGTKYWYAADHLGSNRRMLDQNGNVVWWADYEAFGKVKATGGIVSEAPRFTGKVWDERVELYYFNARWYDIEAGRFINEDPARVDLNFYSYGRNNPLTFTDPTGMIAVSDGEEGPEPPPEPASDDEDSEWLTNDMPPVPLASLEEPPVPPTFVSVDPEKGIAVDSEGNVYTCWRDKSGRVWISAVPFAMAGTYGWTRPIRNQGFWESRKDKWVYPLATKAKEDPSSSDNYFGASRSNGKRSHAGVDFHADAGTEVVSMTDGTVIAAGYFDLGTYQVIIRNSDGTIARYTEIEVSVKAGDTVKAGQVIGKVMKSTLGTEMLHLEVYMGTQEVGLTQKTNRQYKYVPNQNFQRRSDLVNPMGAANLPMAY